MALHESALMAERTVSQADSAPYLRDGKAPSDLPLEEIVSHPEVQARPTQEPQPTFGRDTGGAESATPHAVKSHLFRKLFFAAASLAALLGAAYYGWQYWTVGRFEVSTERCLCPGRQHDHRAQGLGLHRGLCSSPITSRSRPARFSPASTIETSRSRSSRPRPTSPPRSAAIANKQASLVAQQSIIEGAQATITVDQASETFAEQDNKRYASLAATGSGSVQNAQQAVSRIAAARAAVARDKAALVNATKQVDVLKAELAQAQATLAHDQAVQDQAELNLSYTNVVSPVDGVVGNRTLRVGQFVQAGTQLMAVVPYRRRLHRRQLQGDATR